MKAGHAPAGYEYASGSRDAHQHTFEPAGALELINEHSGSDACIVFPIMLSPSSGMHAPSLNSSTELLGGD